MTQRQVENLLRNKGRCYQIKQICSWLVANKATTTATAEHFGVVKSTVYRYASEYVYYIDKELHKKCMEVLELNRHLAHGSKRLDEKHVLRVCHYFVDSDVSTEEASMHFDMTQTVVYRYVNTYVWRYDKELANACRMQLLKNIDKRGTRK